MFADDLIVKFSNIQIFVPSDDVSDELSPGEADQALPVLTLAWKKGD